MPVTSSIYQKQQRPKSLSPKKSKKVSPTPESRTYIRFNSSSRVPQQKSALLVSPVSASAPIAKCLNHIKNERPPRDIKFQVFSITKTHKVIDRENLKLSTFEELQDNPSNYETASICNTTKSSLRVSNFHNSNQYQTEKLDVFNRIFDLPCSYKKQCEIKYGHIHNGSGVPEQTAAENGGPSPGASNSGAFIRSGHSVNTTRQENLGSSPTSMTSPIISNSSVRIVDTKRKPRSMRSPNRRLGKETRCLKAEVIDTNQIDPEESRNRLLDVQYSIKNVGDVNKKKIGKGEENCIPQDQLFCAIEHRSQTADEMLQLLTENKQKGAQSYRTSSLSPSKRNKRSQSRSPRHKNHEILDGMFAEVFRNLIGKNQSPEYSKYNPRAFTDIDGNNCNSDFKDETDTLNNILQAQNSESSTENSSCSAKEDISEEDIYDAKTKVSFTDTTLPTSTNQSNDERKRKKEDFQIEDNTDAKGHSETTIESFPLNTLMSQKCSLCPHSGNESNIGDTNPPIYCLNVREPSVKSVPPLAGKTKYTKVQSKNRLFSKDTQGLLCYCCMLRAKKCESCDEIAPRVEEPCAECKFTRLKEIELATGLAVNLPIRERMCLESDVEDEEEETFDCISLSSQNTSLTCLEKNEKRPAGWDIARPKQEKPESENNLYPTAVEPINVLHALLRKNIHETERIKHLKNKFVERSSSTVLVVSPASITPSEASEPISLDICPRTLETLVDEGIKSTHADLVREHPFDDFDLASLSCSDIVKGSCQGEVSAAGKTLSRVTVCDQVLSDSNVSEVFAILSDIKRYPSFNDLTDLNDEDATLEKPPKSSCSQPEGVGDTESITGVNLSISNVICKQVNIPDKDLSAQLKNYDEQPQNTAETAEVTVKAKNEEVSSHLPTTTEFSPSNSNIEPCYQDADVTLIKKQPVYDLPAYHVFRELELKENQDKKRNKNQNCRSGFGESSDDEDERNSDQEVCMYFKNENDHETNFQEISSGQDLYSCPLSYFSINTPSNFIASSSESIQYPYSSLHCNAITNVENSKIEKSITKSIPKENNKKSLTSYDMPYEMISKNYLKNQSDNNSSNDRHFANSPFQKIRTHTRSIETRVYVNDESVGASRNCDGIPQSLRSINVCQPHMPQKTGYSFEDGLLLKPRNAIDLQRAAPEAITIPDFKRLNAFDFRSRSNYHLEKCDRLIARSARLINMSQTMARISAHQMAHVTKCLKSHNSRQRLRHVMLFDA